MNVAILGASYKPHRYSYMANNLLREHRHVVFLVNPSLAEIEGDKCYSNLAELPKPIDTLTIYLNPAITLKLIDQIEALSIKRVILNPGASSNELMKELTDRNINYLEACTLVMLNTGQF